VGLRPLADRDGGSESLVCVVGCQVEVSATGPITRPEESYGLRCV
jgi:hypothetical protein